MNKLKYIGLSMLTMALMAVTAMAADAPATAGGEKTTSLGTGLAILGFGLAAGLAGIGQGLAGSKGAEGVARNPSASGSITTIMIIALALIESLVLFALLVVFTNLKGG